MNKGDSQKISLLGIAIWILAAIFFLYEFFLRTFVGSVAHQIIPALHLNAETFALIGSAYYIAYALMQVPVGILIDRYGVKKIIIFATIVCAVATFLFAHSMGFFTAFVGRLLMGFGSSFAFVCLLVIAATWFPRKNFGLLAGISQFIGTMGPLLAGGPLIAFLTTSHSSWRSALSMIGMFGFVLAVIAFIIVKNKPRGGEQSLVFLKNSEPLLQKLKKLSQNKQAWLIALYSACVYGSAALLGAIWGTAYLQTRGLSQMFAADAISAIWLGYAVGCPLVGFISDTTQRRKPTLLCCGIIGLLVTAIIAYLPLAHHWLYVPLFFGVGIAAAGQNVGFAIIAEHVEDSTRAAALGLNNGAITGFGAIIPLITSYFINHAVHGHINQLLSSDFTTGFSLMPLMYAISAVLVIFSIKETFCKPQKGIIKLKKNYRATAPYTPSTTAFTSVKESKLPNTPH